MPALSDWVLVVGFVPIIIICVWLVAYGFSLRRAAKLGTRSLYRNPDRVGGGLITFGVVTALICGLGLFSSLSRLISPS